MIRKTKLTDVHPRRDKAYVAHLVDVFLDSCDPDEVVEVKLLTAESATTIAGKGLCYNSVCSNAGPYGCPHAIMNGCK